MAADDEADLLERLRAERSNPQLFERLGDLYAAEPAHLDKAVRNYLEAGRLLLAAVGPERRERAAEAAAVLSKAAALASDRDPILFRLAEAWEAAGAAQDAERVYRHLLTRSTAEERPFFHLALLERIATLAPHDLEHRRFTARTRERLGMHASAAHDLAEMARIEARAGLEGAATADAEHALRLLPGAAELLEARAEVADLLGDREGAARAWLEAAAAWRQSGDEARGRLAADHAIAPAEVQPLGGEAEGGSALLVLADPLLLAHAESLVLGVGLTPLRARSADIATLPANLRVALVETTSLGDGAAWDAVVGLRAATHAELPVAVVETEAHPLGEDDRSMLAAAQIPVVGAAAPFATLARLLGEAAARRSEAELRSLDEPLLPFEDLPPVPEPSTSREAPAPTVSVVDFEARFPQVAGFIRALKLDGARREAEIAHTRREAAESDQRARSAEREQAALGASLQSTRRELEEGTARLEAQRRLAERLREESDAAKQHIARFGTELGLAHQRGDELGQEVARLGRELDLARDTVRALEGTQESLRSELQALRTEAESARRYAATRLEVERERDARGEEAARAREAERRTREELDRTEAERGAVELKLGAEKTARRSAEQLLLELKESLAAAERELDANRARIREAERERQALESELQSERSQRRSLDTQVSGLGEQLGVAGRELEGARAAIEEGERRLAAAEARAEAQRSELGQRLDHALHSLAAERNALEQRGRTLEQELGAAREAEAGLVAQATTAAAAASRERLELEARIERLEGELSALRLRQDEVGLALVAEREAHSRTRVELERRQERLARLEVECQELGGALAGNRQSVAEAGAALAHARAEAAAERSENEAMAARFAELAATLARERSSRAEAEGLVARREAESAGTFLELEQVRATLAARENELGERVRACADATREVERLIHEQGRLEAAGAAAEARTGSVQSELLAVRARLLGAEQSAAMVAVDRDRLAAEVGAGREAMDKLRESLNARATELSRLELSERAAREQLERTSGQYLVLKSEAEARARRGFLRALFADLSPGSFGLGLVTALASTALLLAVLRLSGTTPVPGIAPGKVAAETARTGPAAVPVESAAAKAPSAASASPPRGGPIGLADYADIEQQLVRRVEGPGYRVTAKLKTAEEVRAALAYQAGSRGWGAAELEAEIQRALGSDPGAFRFAQRTYVDVLVENHGLGLDFDINSVAAAFSLDRDGRVVNPEVSRRVEPKVVTSSTGGPATVQALTLSLEFAEPTAFPTRLRFRLPGSDPAALDFEAAP